MVSFFSRSTGTVALVIVDVKCIDDTVHSGYATRPHTTISRGTITDTDNTDVVYGISQKVQVYYQFIIVLLYLEQI